MDPLFSVIVPCYNHGAFLRRNIKSVEAVEGIPMEIIIVDDGSTDETTVQELQQLKNEGYHIIIQKNSGPAAARNNAIGQSKGKYIVPLDADDMLRKEYIAAAKEVFEGNKQIDIVYANFQQFGESTAVQQYCDFVLQELLLQNNIGACAIYRKEVWQAIGGYDEKLWRDLGWEDWEFWLNAAKHGFKFQYLDMIGYDYYYQNSSRERTFLRDRKKLNNTISYYEQKHKGFYTPSVIHNNLIHQVRMNPVGMLLKIITATFLPKYYNKSLQKGKIRKYLF